jgi:glucosamine--fructose-6-phosphate aminotransferase (isomerizing)
MCSIVGYIGPNCRDTIVNSLARLEYRGYDSAGLGCYDLHHRRISIIRSVGGVADLQQALQQQQYVVQGTVGLGHTRWSTHGVVSEHNAHPVVDCMQRCAVVQNGTLENDSALRAALIQNGHHFFSQTDSELIAHCFEECLTAHQQKSLTNEQLAEMMRVVVQRLQGTYAFVALLEDAPDVLLIARNRLPLCVGVGKDAIFVVSDPLACAGSVDRFFFMPDESYALVTKTDLQLFSLSGTPQPVLYEPATVVWDESGKQGHEHYMLKEIYEQPEVLRTVAHYSKHDIEKFFEAHRAIAHEVLIRLVGCGASAHAAQLSQLFFEKIAQLPTTLFIATDMRERPLFSPPHAWAFVLSQSGETADVLESVRLMQEHGMHIAGITNVATSTLARMSNHTIPIRAGTEVAVASTKSLLAHVGVLYLLAHEYAYRRTLITRAQRDAASIVLTHTADLLQEQLNQCAPLCQQVAQQIAQLSRMFIIGRGESYPVAREAALKLKEIAYLFAEACPAGELKHGPLALIDAEMHVLVCSVLDEVAYRKLVINVQQIRSRKGKIISIIFEGQDELCSLSDIYIALKRPPDVLLAPVIMTGIVQYLIYQVAYILGRPIDKPRNLAKSVTVE